MPHFDIPPALAAMFDTAVELDEQVDPSASWSLENFCGEHVKQYGYTTDRSSQWIHCMAARQSGKSWGDDGILLDNAEEEPESLNVLLGLKGTAVRQNNWIPIWNRGLCDKYKIGHNPNQQMMMSMFPNGSRVLFGGTDDISHVRNALGNNLGNGVFIIDESQDQPGAILDDLLDNILPPMLGPRARVILSGVIPDVPAGRFWEESAFARAATGKLSRFKSQHNWGRFDNCHTPYARAMLEQYLRDTGLTLDDPKIQRDWFGNPVFDPTATGYMYSGTRNGYHPELLEWADAVMATGIRLPPSEEHPEGRIFKPTGRMMAAKPLDWVEWISFALDTAGRKDRVSIQGVGWGRKSQKIQHLFDWTSETKQRHTTSEMFGVLALARNNYSSGTGRGILPLKYDAGSSPFTIDNLERDFKIPVVVAANKGSLKAGVDRTNTLFRELHLMLMIGSHWEEDCQKARRSPIAAAVGRFEWASSWHPDASEAGRYALEHYWDTYKSPAPPAKILTPYEEFQRREAEKMNKARQLHGYSGQRVGFGR